MSDRPGSLVGGAADDELPPPGGSTDDDDALPVLSLEAPGDGTVPANGRPPGSTIFSLEGRAAPGLYLVGWLGSILGLAILFAVILSGPTGIGALVLALLAASLLAVGLVAAAGAQGMQRRDRGDAYAGPSPILVFLASIPIALPVAVFALRIAEGAGVDPAGPLGSVIGQTALVLGLIALVRLLVVGTGALSWSEMGIRWPGAGAALGHLASGAVLAVPVIIVTVLVSAILIGLLGTVPESPLPAATDATGIALNLLAAVIIAPIGEEIFFRGFSLTAWERSLGWRRALLRAALFFAFVHVLTVGGATFNEAAARAFIGFAVRIPVALALGWVFIQRRSIFAPIGLHAAYNAILVVVGILSATRTP